MTYRICAATAGLLGRDADGCFAELVAVDEALLHPIPDSVAPDAAALLQVLSTCVHAQSRLSPSPEDSAVVIGLGVTGLLHVQLLRARGLRTLIGVTRSEWKRDLARRLGASATATPDEAADAVGAATDGRGARIAIDCAWHVGHVRSGHPARGRGRHGRRLRHHHARHRRHAIRVVHQGTHHSQPARRTAP